MIRRQNKRIIPSFPEAMAAVHRASGKIQTTTRRGRLPYAAAPTAGASLADRSDCSMGPSPKD